MLSQTEFEEILKKLEIGQTESDDFESKQDLALDMDGDKAFFIRHIAALANNVNSSYLIIGVENKTWKPVGIQQNSPLFNSDKTQNRMNQILENRLDPNLSIRYHTYQISGVTLGLVIIEGVHAPYIVSIEDQQYGGNRTRGSDCFIYRGAIYIRHGANSIIANRQSSILRIIDVPKNNAHEKNNFLDNFNYADVDSPDFGHHNLSDNLIEIHSNENGGGDQNYSSADSWVSFIFYPLEDPCILDTVVLKNKLYSDQRIGRDGEWYHGLPSYVYNMLLSPHATPREFSSTHSLHDVEGYTHFIRIRPSGFIETACTYPLFYVRQNVRYFLYVNIIGYLWQLTYLVKAIFKDAGYQNRLLIGLNLIGTKETWIGDYANSSKRGGWRPLFDLMNPYSKQTQNLDQNIQIKRELSLFTTSDDKIEEVIREIANELSLYYGHKIPRCFDCKTGEFPYRDFCNRGY